MPVVAVRMSTDLHPDSSIRGLGNNMKVSLVYEKIMAPMNKTDGYYTYLTVMMWKCDQLTLDHGEQGL